MSYNLQCVFQQKWVTDSNEFFCRNFSSWVTWHTGLISCEVIITDQQFIEFLNQIIWFFSILLWHAAIRSNDNIKIMIYLRSYIWWENKYSYIKSVVLFRLIIPTDVIIEKSDNTLDVIVSFYLYLAAYYIFSRTLSYP